MGSITPFFVIFLIIVIFAGTGVGMALIGPGSEGDEVRFLQYQLNRWGYYCGPVDGIFGKQTAWAVQAFQKHNLLEADGLLNTATRKALSLHGTPLPPTREKSPRPDDNINLLARVISAETRGEPYPGMVAVGAVILNRVRDPAFPGSLSGVVFQPLAFASVNNGEVNLAPTEEALRAARDALSGFDPSNGSLYFWDPGKPVNPWIWTREILVRVGNHVFGR